MAYAPRRTVTRAASDVLLARESELEPADRFGAIFGIVWSMGVGAVAIGMFIVDRVPPFSFGGVILFAMSAVTLTVLLRSVRVLTRRHRLRLLPAQRCVEETWTDWGKERSERHALDAFDTVVLEFKEFKNAKTEETFDAYAVSLSGESSGALLLGMYMDLGKALDHAIGAARATGLKLVDHGSVGKTKIVPAERLERLATARDRDEEQEYATPWWRRASVIALVIANLVPAFGVLFLGWDVLRVMVLYWAENLVVGLMAVLRFLCAVRELRARVLMIPFFVLHYGGFCYGHGVAVLVLFGDGIRASLPAGPISIASLASLVVLLNLWFGILSLLASHGYSFVRNFLGQREYKRANGLLLMMAPYKRVIVMHASVILAAVAINALDAPSAALVLMIFGKIGLDVHAHLGERRRYSLADYDRIE